MVDKATAPADVQDDDLELSAEDILQSNDIFENLRRVFVPEWKRAGRSGYIYLKPMTAAEFIRARRDAKTIKNKDDGIVDSVVKSACDKNGKLLFDHKSAEALKEKNVAVFVRLQDTILEMNGITRKPKTWEELKPILESAGVDPSVVALVESKWDKPEDEQKNS